MNQLLAVDVQQWQAEAEAIGRFFDELGDSLPAALRQQHAALVARLAAKARQ